MHFSPCYVDLVVPVPVNETFTYITPRHLKDDLQVGKRVLINFGVQGIQTGVIVNIKKQYQVQTHQLKEIIDVIDEFPVLNNEQIKLLYWISSYYMTPIGEVLKTLLPAGLRLSSNSMLQLNPEFNFDIEENEQRKNSHNKRHFSREALKIIHHLSSHAVISYNDVPKIIAKEEQGTLFNHTDKNIRKKNTHPKVIKSLLKKKVLLVMDHIKEKYTPKTERRFRLHSDYLQSNILEELIASLKNYSGQQRILLLYLNQYPLTILHKNNNEGVPFQLIKKRNLSISSYNTLRKNNIIVEFKKIIPRVLIQNTPLQKTPPLNEMQANALEKIDNYFNTKGSIALLFGKTGSGKTMLYIHKIQEILSKDKQVLLLMPEIALTAQMTQRLSLVFGENMAIYHSQFSDNERVEIWRGVLNGKIKFVLGVRSAIFLPFQALALIIMDEAHESSYKQHQKMPHYNTYTVCVTLSKLYNCNLLLGSGTPDIPSMHLAKSNKIGLVMMPFRYGQGQPPRFHWIDLKKNKAEQTMYNAFAIDTIEKIKQVCQEGHQVLVFKNRRGYSTSIRCDACQSTPSCPKCDVSLTYHLYSDKLRCHYCGYNENPLGVCLICGGQRLKSVGYGTEKIVEDLELLIPESKILRLDSDSTKSKYSYDKIITSFSNKEANILVGTQMITKGLDFDYVRLVVVVDIDRMLYSSDYRALEKTFHTLVQVGGRAGRKDTLGEVWVQTYQPKNQIFKWAEDDDSENLYDNEIKERALFNYPPFVKLIRLEIKNKIEKKVIENAQSIFQVLVKGLGYNRVLGPVEPFLSKINLWHIRHIIIKLENNLNKEKVLMIKQNILNLCQDFKSQAHNRNTRVIINVDI